MPGLGISVPASHSGGVLRRSSELHRFVFCCHLWICYEQVAKMEELPPQKTIHIHNVNKEPANPRIPAVDPMVWNPDGAGIVITKRRHGILPIIGKRVARCRNGDINDRLRLQARNCSAADVLNIDCVRRQNRAESPSFLAEQPCPVRIVRDEVVMSMRKPERHGTCQTNDSRVKADNFHVPV